jgi:hypothetical protein
MSYRCWGFIAEVYVTWMPHPSLQGRIGGVFWHKPPIPVTVLDLCSIITTNHRYPKLQKIY